MRDPTDQFDLPDHVAWQMNLAVEHGNVSLEAKGILGETMVPTVDDGGRPIMHGMEAIRGKQEDCELPPVVLIKHSRKHTELGARKRNLKRNRPWLFACARIQSPQ